MNEDDDELIPTRQSLLSLLKEQTNDESWKVFFDTYWKLIYGAAIKAGLTNSEAQDAVQETVISVMKSMPEFEYQPVGGSFKRWLLQLTTWRVNDQFRKRLRVVDLPRRNSDSSTGTNPIDQFPDTAVQMMGNLWDEEWEKNLMDAALNRVKAKVDERNYQIFDLYAFKKWPVAKITRTLGISSAKVYLAKHRVGALIKKEINKIKSQPLTKKYE